MSAGVFAPAFKDHKAVCQNEDYSTSAFSLLSLES